eukprot:CAMPEP_0174736042 /NCGR_PEP_ID=MMETSP1094-20130205/65986_1 /TAXON_ID=156173 /ORGANISM="Chrysochromulina brevifilum, Strain UTEX LB 985" /LENGTH=141 /DNA_ID=CAMNT_0015939091 /DNA_START=193 /DNA_END=617 /DNA_ORIENTATION=+
MLHNKQLFVLAVGTSGGRTVLGALRLRGRHEELEAVRGAYLGQREELVEHLLDQAAPAAHHRLRARALARAVALFKAQLTLPIVDDCGGRVAALPGGRENALTSEAVEKLKESREALANNSGAAYSLDAEHVAHVGVALVA